MRAEVIFPLIYFICLLLLIGPRFLNTHSSLRQFLNNFTVWAFIVLMIGGGYQIYQYFT